MKYIDRLIKATKQLKQRKISGLIDSCIQHDDSCPMVNGGNKCKCVPDIVLTTAVGKFEVDRKGRLNQAAPARELTPVMFDPRNRGLN